MRARSLILTRFPGHLIAQETAPSRLLPPPRPSQAPLPVPAVGPVLNRAQRRQAEREQRHHST